MTEAKPKEVTPGMKAKFGWNWKRWLQPNDSISSYTITVTAGLTVVGSTSLEDNVVGAMIQVSDAAVAGQKLSALCKVTTVNGFIQSRTIFTEVFIR